ncbi:ATP-dependent helicase [Clostridium uliginosum]|uniref:Superfamily I DNA or RNA helicase n=1 Tax=Clostridium uliginosum TaxID=119641 RepID=A0A1I1P6C4_9CLOT|nr:ATP-dependent helicase [Clostridium uliginosum]SFD05377.1 Superfamily I DNA or RNA helicase [Clostridium uliginosum]
MIPNKEQEIIINYFTRDTDRKRILLVEAPPGTGKTYTAVSASMNYIRWNLEKDFKYNKKVLILTFSKNARAQIDKQLDDLDFNKNKISDYIEISNFHSFFQKYVWAYSNYLGLNANLIITSPKQRKIYFEEALSHISDYTGEDEQYAWVDSLLEGDFYPITPKGNIKPAVKKLIPYKEEIQNSIMKLNKEGYMGFSDIGYYMNKLLEKSSSLLNIIQNKYPLIILDEYQDASDLQDTIVKKLIGKSNNAIFFADSKQMIYGWRGASSNRIINLREEYGEQIEQSELVTSMRFKGRKDIEGILRTAREGKYDINSFISSENAKYIKIKVRDKNLFSKQSKNIMYSNLKYKIINALPKFEERKDKSIGILCRYNEQVRFIKKALREEFNVYSQTISNNEEEHNIVCDLIDFYVKQDQGISIDELSQEIVKYIFSVVYDDGIGAIKRNKLSSVGYSNLKNARLQFLKQVAAYVEKADESREYWGCLSNCINLVPYSELKINHDNLSLIRKILLTNNKSADKITDLFLQYQYQKAFKELKGIYVLNVHQSKGREFDFVYLVDRESLNREQNLLYVALSRVKEKITIFDWVL